MRAENAAGPDPLLAGTLPPGTVILKDSHLRGVFEALRDPAVFAQVSCEEGFVEWPGEIDLAPDAMHDEIRAHGQWILD